MSDAANVIVTVEKLTGVTLAAIAVVEALIRAGNIDRGAVVAAVTQMISGLSPELRNGTMGAVLAHWLRALELGPEKVSPPTFH